MQVNEIHPQVSGEERERTLCRITEEMLKIAEKVLQERESTK